MLIRGTETRNINVSITDEEFNNLVMDKLYRLYKWSSDWYISDNYVRETVNVSHTFTFYEVEDVREATEKDKKTYEILQDVKSKLKDSIKG